VIFGLQGFSQSTVEKTLGKNKFDSFDAVTKTPDGGMVFLGRLDPDGFGNGAFYLVKTDANTDTLWTKIYESGNSAEGYSIDITADSGFIFTGNMYDYAGTDYDIYVVRTDKNGNILWSKIFGGSGYDFSYSIKSTTDDGFILAATTDSYGPGDYNMYIIKGDVNGDTLWTRITGTDSIEYATIALQANDGGYIIGGQSWGIGQGEGDFYLIKLDSQGDHVWSKTYGGRWDEDMYSIAKTFDGGYIMSGNTESWIGGVLTPTNTHPANNKQDVYIVKIDEFGDTLWTGTFGGVNFDNGRNIKQTSDSGYIFAGRSYSFSSSQDIYLVKLNSSGDTLWTRKFDGGYSESGYEVEEHPDGGYIIAGYSNSFTATTDGMIIKTDINGNSGCNFYPANSKTGSSSAVVTALPAPQFFYGDGGIAGTLTEPLRTIDYSELCKCVITAALAGPDSICSGDPAILSVQGGKYYFWDDGSQNDSLIVSPISTTTYEVAVSNDTCSFLFKHTVIVSVCTGLKDNFKMPVTIYPNPSAGDFTISLDDNQSSDTKQLLVYNILGEKIMETTFSGNTFIINENFLPGLYFYQLSDISEKSILSEGKLIKVN
jgi:hypothetical protein